MSLQAAKHINPVGWGGGVDNNIIFEYISITVASSYQEYEINRMY